MIFLVMLIGFFGACYGSSAPGAGVPGGKEAGAHAMCPGGSECPVRGMWDSNPAEALKHLRDCHGALRCVDLSCLWRLSPEKLIALIKEKGLDNSSYPVSIATTLNHLLFVRAPNEYVELLTHNKDKPEYVLTDWNQVSRCIIKTVIPHICKYVTFFETSWVLWKDIDLRIVHRSLSSLKEVIARSMDSDLSDEAKKSLQRVLARVDKLLTQIEIAIQQQDRWRAHGGTVHTLATAWQRHGGVVPPVASEAGMPPLAALLRHRRLCRTRDGDSEEVVEPWGRDVVRYLGAPLGDT